MKDKQIFKELDLVDNFLKSFPHVMNLSEHYYPYPYVIGLDKKEIHTIFKRFNQEHNITIFL